jgi:hypothetical protein
MRTSYPFKERAVLPPVVEAVHGDLLSPESIPFGGVSRMHLFPEPRTAREVVTRAVAAGVERIVTLSSGAVTSGFDTDFQLPVEQAVIRAGRVVRYAQPEAPSLAIHDGDIATVAVTALLSDGHAGRWYDLTGPALLTRREQVAAIGEALGEEVRFEEVSAAEARKILRAQGGWGAENADFLLGFAEYSAGGTSLEDVDWAEALKPLPTVEEVLGRPARTYAQWAHDNADAFRW